MLSDLLADELSRIVDFELEAIMNIILLNKINFVKRTISILCINLFNSDEKV